MADTMQPMDQRELMTLQHYLKEYGQQAEIFVSQLELLENGRIEALAAIESLEDMLVSGDGIVLLQIGGGASVRAKVLEPEKVLLAIGAEVVGGHHMRPLERAACVVLVEPHHVAEVGQADRLCPIRVATQAKDYKIS